MGTTKYPLIHVSTNQFSTFHHWKQITFKEKPVLPLIQFPQFSNPQKREGKEGLRKEKETYSSASDVIPYDRALRKYFCTAFRVFLCCLRYQKFRDFSIHVSLYLQKERCIFLKECHCTTGFWGLVSNFLRFTT